MFCVKCRASLPDDANFCFKCGCDLRNLNREWKFGTVYSAVKVGDYVKFGSYPQNSIEVKEPIEWLALEVNGNEALLVSLYGLDCKRYHHEFTEITWENCDLRKWLNADFLEAAFTEEEQRRIRLSDVVNDNNPKYGTSGGNNTRDRIFCLSLAEAERYFNGEGERLCRGTKLAYTHGAYLDKNSACWWWLRSSGEDRSMVSKVGMFGDLDDFGDSVNDDDTAVRPALWMDLTSSNP